MDSELQAFTVFLDTDNILHISYNDRVSHLGWFNYL